MGTATLLAEGLGGYAGTANLYQLDPPLMNHSHVVVWTQAYGTPEAVIVSARPDGSAITLNRLPGSYVGAEVNHTAALWLAGYEITAPAPPTEDTP